MNVHISFLRPACYMRLPHLDENSRNKILAIHMIIFMGKKYRIRAMFLYGVIASNNS